MLSKGLCNRVGVVFGVAIALLAGSVGYRSWVFKREAHLRAGISALKEGNYSLALAKIRPHAEEGNREAQIWIGTMYAFGLGVPYDEVQASIWFRRSERGQKVTGGQEYGVARRYLSNDTSMHNIAKAAVWLQRAAEAGNVDAQRLLADEKWVAEKGLKIEPSVSEYWRQFVLSQR